MHASAYVADNIYASVHVAFKLFHSLKHVGCPQWLKHMWLAHAHLSMLCIHLVYVQICMRVQSTQRKMNQLVHTTITQQQQFSKFLLEYLMR